MRCCATESDDDAADKVSERKSMLQGSVYFREGRAFRNARCIGSKDTAVLSHNRAETAEEKEFLNIHLSVASFS